MTQTSDISIHLDDRVRVVSAALAATQYPAQAQARRPHGTHAHARATRKHVSAYVDHDAVQALQALLDAGASLEEIFTMALSGGAPALDDALNDFCEASNLAAWWQNEEGWEKSLTHVTELFRSVQLQPFLQPYVGEIQQRLVFVPNICYPTDYELALRIGGDLVLIVPPRLAWGDSPPWPYNEDPAHVYRAALAGYGRLLMQDYLRQYPEDAAAAAEKPLPVSDQFRALHPSWDDQFINLFVAGLVAIFLEEHISSAEANAYILMERKLNGLDALPGVITIFRRYVGELNTGHYRGMVDLLPHFAKQLKVANRLARL